MEVEGRFELLSLKKKKRHVDKLFGNKVLTRSAWRCMKCPKAETESREVYSQSMYYFLSCCASLCPSEPAYTQKSKTIISEAT